jgi:hypothetical protein
VTDIPIHESRHERYGRTEKKTVTLTNEAIEAIQNYAKEHNLYFSVALESLALMSLGQTTAETLPRLVANLLERTINWQFSRFAKLHSQSILAAEAVNYKVDLLLLQTIWREAQLDPDNFVEKLQVSTNPQTQPDARTRELRDEMCGHAHDVAVTRLKKALGEDEPLLPQEVADAAE